MAILKNLLDEVAEGRTSFAPASTSKPDMIEFQPIAKALCFASDEGYLDGFVSHKEKQTGNDWYDLILVKSGLSHKGELFRIERSAEAENKLADIVQLKPNIYGIGVDLKALWERWKGRNA